MVTYTATRGLFLVSELASVGSAVLIKSVGVAHSYPAWAPDCINNNNNKFFRDHNYTFVQQQ